MGHETWGGGHGFSEIFHRIFRGTIFWVSKPFHQTSIVWLAACKIIWCSTPLRGEQAGHRHRRIPQTAGNHHCAPNQATWIKSRNSFRNVAHEFEWIAVLNPMDLRLSIWLARAPGYDSLRISGFQIQFKKGVVKVGFGVNSWAKTEIWRRHFGQSYPK